MSVPGESVPGKWRSQMPSQKHCKALMAANKKFDAFEAAVRAFYQLIYDDVKGDRQAFLSTVKETQVALRNGPMPLARINDGREKAGEWFDLIARSTHH